jgi:hypothetical protein
MPECQHPRPGDDVLLHPKVLFPVAMVKPGGTLVLHYDTRTGLVPIPGTKQVDYFESIWFFITDAADGNTSRLISRFRIDYSASARNSISYGYFVEPISTTMQKQMLGGIKRPVEASRAARNPPERPEERDHEERI